MKVYCRDPDFVSKCSKAFRNLEGVKDCLEDDIRYSMPYSIDNKVIPCGWHRIEFAEEANTLDVQVDKVHKAKSLPKLVGKTEVPQLRILSFSQVNLKK